MERSTNANVSVSRGPRWQRGTMPGRSQAKRRQTRALTGSVTTPSLGKMRTQRPRQELEATTHRSYGVISLILWGYTEHDARSQPRVGRHTEVTTRRWQRHTSKPKWVFTATEDSLPQRASSFFETKEVKKVMSTVSVQQKKERKIQVAS